MTFLYFFFRQLTDIQTVIRLKQVEHIRNERNTLATVAGHPFITTMITSFSDRDSLYMLVREPVVNYCHFVC
jgi:serine/threonine protein kinase